MIQAMLADSLTELFAARALVYETARGIDAGADVKVQHAQCSMAKLYASEMAGRVADRAVQIFGGRGYMRENVAERFYRELRVERIWEGTSEVQKVIIAEQRPWCRAAARSAQLRAASTASTTSDDSGSISGRNRRTGLPPATRNFSKFHWMSPAWPSPSASSVSSW